MTYLPADPPMIFSRLAGREGSIWPEEWKHEKLRAARDLTTRSGRSTIIDDATETLLIERATRGALIGGVALLLSMMLSHHSYYFDFLTASIVWLMSLMHRTLIVSVTITALLGLLSLFQPEVATNIAAWAKAARG